MRELYEYSAVELRGLVRARDVTRVEVVEAHARQIEQSNGAVNAFVVLRLDEARAEAAAADARHDERAELALDGVPVSVKEAFDLAGYESTLGLPARRGLMSPIRQPVLRCSRRLPSQLSQRILLPDYPQDLLPPYQEAF